MDGRWWAAHPRVVSEVIDGEAILIDTESGVYYSLPHSGAHAWELLVDGTSARDVAHTWGVRFECDEDAVLGIAKGFLEELARDELIVAASEPSTPPSTAAASPAAAGSRPPFEPPQLARYTDMQELLLVDPIHEVDDQGWPRKRG